MVKLQHQSYRTSEVKGNSYQRIAAGAMVRA